MNILQDSTDLSNMTIDISVDGERQVIDLMRTDCFGDFSEAAIVVDVDYLSRLPVGLLVLAVNQILAHEQTIASVGFSIRGNQLQGNFFDSTCEMLRRSQGEDRHRALSLVTEVATGFFETPGSIRIACSDIADILKRIGVRCTANQLYRSVVESAAARHGQVGNSRSAAVADTWEGVNEDLQVPSRWSLGDSAIIAQDGCEFIGRAYISRLFRDIEGDTYYVELSWWRNGRWFSRTVPKEAIATKRGIVDLASYGLNVTGNNAAMLIDYLSDFENENIDLIPVTQIAKRLGWFEQGQQSIFLLGDTCVVQGATGETENASVRFRGGDEGDEQTASSLRASGTAEAWYSTISNVRHLNRVMLGIYASLGACVLRIVQSPNFIVSYDGRTSQGKSTVQMIAASLWGYPVVNGPGGNSFVHGWDATKVFIERAATIYNGLPLILDDTKNARDRAHVVSTIYQYAGGAGRGRGSQAGIAAKSSWQGVLISSGEEPIISYSKDGGSRARVLGMWGSPFQGLEDAGSVIAQATQCLEENYGHVGPIFVDYLVRHQSLWGGWRDLYRQARQRYLQRAGSNVVAGRMAAHFAALELTAFLAHQSVFQWDYDDAVANLWPELTAGTDEADQGLAALHFIIGWANSNKSRFETPRTAHDGPSSGWFGRWEVALTSEPSEIILAIYPQHLEDALEQRGYASAAITKLWKDAGWLRTEEGKTKIRLTVGAGKSSMIAIRWAVINELMNSDIPEHSLGTTGIE